MRPLLTTANTLRRRIQGADAPRSGGKIHNMRQQLGFLLQLAVLGILPVLSYWQLQNGFPLIWMPGLLLAGAVMFWLGTRLRESK